MCLMLHNNIFFLRPLLIWITLAVSLFLFLLILLYLSLFQCFSPSLSHLCLIIFRHQIESKFVFWIQHKNAGSLNYCSKEAHDLPLHDSSAQVWLSTQKFLLICLICSSSARVHTQHGYAFKVWWSIPPWSTWQNSALLMQEEKHQVLGQRVVLCQSKPDLLMSQSVHQSVGPTSFSQLQETEKRSASLLHFPLFLSDPFLDVFLDVLQLPHLFFLSFSSLGEKMLFAHTHTHTHLMCYTWANPRDSHSQSLNKSPPPPPSKPDAVICVQCFH